MLLSSGKVNTFKRLLKTSITKRSYAKRIWWYPDAEYMKQFLGPVMYPDEVTSKWKQKPWSNQQQTKEMTVKNMVINFGCAHPAAHGLLRLVVELDGEVSIVGTKIVENTT